MLNSYLDLKFDVLHAATGNIYIDGNDIRLVILGPISSFSKYKLKTSSGKHLEDINPAYIFSLLYKLITSARNTDLLSNGFDRDRDRDKRQRELTNYKTQKSNFHPRIHLKDIFGFLEHQDKATYGLRYKLTLTKNTVNAVLTKDNALNDAQTKNKAIECYVTHYTPSISNQAILFNQILSRTPTELQYVETSVFMEEVKIQNFGTFELRTQEAINVHLWNIVGFQQMDRQNSRILNNDTFNRAPVTSAQCIIGTGKYPDFGILINSNDDDYSQGYDQIKKALRALTKDDVLLQFKSEHAFRSTNNGDDIGYKLYVFDIRYQKSLESGQTIKIDFNFSNNILVGIYGYALVVTNKLVSIISYGQRHFDLI